MSNSRTFPGFPDPWEPCVGDVMDVVFSVCIVRHGAVGAPVWGV